MGDTLLKSGTVLGEILSSCLSRPGLIRAVLWMSAQFELELR